MTRRWPQVPLPTRRYLPGHGRHPRYGSHVPPLEGRHTDPWSDARWLYGLDLFDHHFWWEAHEVWESLWLDQVRTSPPAQLIQGMIQLAAARLTEELGRPAASQRLRLRATRRLQLAGVYLSDEQTGLDIASVLTVDALPAPCSQAP